MLIPIDKSNLKKHLPEFAVVDFDSEFEVEDAEHDKLRAQALDVFNQFFIDTATWGLSKWENIYGITDGSGDYDVRRARVKAKMRGAQLVTVDFMKNLVADFCTPEASVLIKEYPDEYCFEIVIRGGRLLSSEDMSKAVHIYKPAHLAIKYRLEFINNLSGVERNGKIKYALANFVSGTVSRGTERPVNHNLDFNYGTVRFLSGKTYVSLERPQNLEVKISYNSYTVKIGKTSMGCDMRELKNYKKYL